MFARISIQFARMEILANPCKLNSPCKCPRLQGESLQIDIRWHNTCKSLQKHHCKDLQGLMNAELAGFARMATLANPCTEN